jgi:hypothetical protein
MLDYTLVENQLTSAPDDYMAHTANLQTSTNVEIADAIVRLNVGISKVQIIALLEAYEQVLTNIIAAGGAVNTRIFNAQPSIAGVFEGADDNYDPTRHRIKINLNAGVALREAIKHVKVKKVVKADSIPVIAEVKDTASGSVNENLTSGSIVQITGSKLKMLESNHSNGVFLISTIGDEVRVEQIANNTPTSIIGMLPANLPVGDYYLEVRTTYTPGGKGFTNNMKIGRFAKLLHVTEQ